MAKVLFSALLTDARKKIGTVVFQKGRVGSIARKKVSPSQPRTTSQRNVRADFKSHSQAWPGTLTQTQRSGWLTLANNTTIKDRFGNPFHPEGIQMFQRVNRFLSTIAVAPLTTAPTAQSVGNPVTATLTATAGTPALSIAVGTNPAAAEVPVVYAAPPQSQGRLGAGKRFTYLFKAAAAAAGPYNILSAYTTKYGSLAIGQNIFTQVEYINNTTGAASGRFQASAIITA